MYVFLEHYRLFFLNRRHLLQSLQVIMQYAMQMQQVFFLFYLYLKKRVKEMRDTQGSP